jgi:Helix-turn-helix.
MRMVKTPEGSPPPSLGDLIGHILAELDITKAKLAGLVGMNPSQLSRWTSGATKPSFESLVKLGEALVERYPHLGIGPAELLAAGGYSDAAAHGPPPSARAVRATAQIPEPQATLIADTLTQVVFNTNARLEAIEKQIAALRTEHAELRDENAALRNALEDVRRQLGQVGQVRQGRTKTA